jgi:hypothetical protein
MSKDKILEGTSYTNDKTESANESRIFKSIGTKPAATKPEVLIKADEENRGFDDTFWENLLK